MFAPRNLIHYILFIHRLEPVRVSRNVGILDGTSGVVLRMKALVSFLLCWLTIARISAAVTRIPSTAFSMVPGSNSICKLVRTASATRTTSAIPFLEYIYIYDKDIPSFLLYCIRKRYNTFVAREITVSMRPFTTSSCLRLRSANAFTRYGFMIAKESRFSL